MNNTQELIIYLDMFAFLFLIVFFVVLFKSKSLFIDKKKGSI